MKRLIPVFALVFACFGASADRRSLIISRNNASAAPGSTTWTETFEGTGYSNATTETGVNCDEDNATSPPEGSQNLSITGGAGYAYPTAGFAASGQSVITMDFWFRVSAVAANNEIFTIDATPNGAARGYIWVTAGAKLQIYGNGAGSVSATTTDSISANTWYKARAIFNKLTGVYSIEFNLTGVFNGSGTDFATASDGDTGVTMRSLRYECTNVGYTALLDGISVTY
jgi:hypothetical protein